MEIRNMQPGKSHVIELNELTATKMKRLQYSVFFGDRESNGYPCNGGRGGWEPELFCFDGHHGYTTNGL